MKTNISQEDYTLMKINEALEKNVWHDITPEYLKDLRKRRKLHLEELKKFENDNIKK